MVVKFNADLEVFRQQTEAEAAELYEDAYTSFTLANVRVEDGQLIYEYDGREERIDEVVYDEDEHVYGENDSWDSIEEMVKFWRKCLNRAKRYWATDPDTLDRIQDGLIEDKEK
jgi:hypothetical protein